MPSANHRRMFEMQARLAPLKGFDSRPKKQSKASTPVLHDAVFGMDLSASENAFVRNTFGSQEMLTQDLQQTSSKEVPACSDCDGLPQHEDGM
jgi:hypothetical protein